MTAQRVNLDERSEDLERLLDELTKIMRGIGVELDEEKREALRSSVTPAVSWYGVLQWSKDDDAASEAALRKLRTPLTTTLKMLKHPVLESAISYTLGKGDLPPGHCDIELGAERREALISALEEIAASLPPSRRRRTSGNPGNRDLHQLVHTLANDWIGLTEHHFSQSSKGGASAANAATRFVYAYVDFVDPSARKQVRR